MVDYDFKSEFNERWSPLVKNIMRLLSENSRISVTEISKRLGVARKTIDEKMRKAEEELGIKYTLELDERKLGLGDPHIILVTFIEKPDYEDITKILNASHIPQVVSVVNGTYDMFIYANAESPDEYVYWDKTTQIQLAKYKVHWQPSDLAFRHLGFFPLRNSLLSRLEIPEIYKKIILLMNENSRMSFSEMAKKLGMKQNTLVYNFKKLQRAGYIKRFTIIMRKAAGVSMVSLFGKYIIARGFEDDSMNMRKEITFMDDRLPLISRCLFSAQLIGSYDFFFVGVYDSDQVGYEHLVKYYKMRFKKHSVKPAYGTISRSLIGDFPTRNLDVKKEFNMIRWVPGTQPKVERLE